MERILIVRLGALGDVLHALPAVTALRAALPQARFGWAVEERWAELLCAREARLDAPRGPEKPLVDVLHFVNTRAWRAAPFSDETWGEARGVWRALRDSRYDAVLDFQGALKSAAVAAASVAPRRLGYARPWERPAAMLYSHRVSAHSAHVVEQALELASAAAGRRLHYQPPLLPRDAEDERWAEDELKRRGVRDFAILTPGAGWGAKQWPAERYAEVARALAEIGLQSLVNHGPGEEPLAQEVERASGGAASALRCSVSELIAVTRRAKLAVGGDTGPVHLAAALEVPVVALYGPTDPRRSGPFGTPAVVLRSERSATSHARRAAPEAGLLEITVAQVVGAARSLLEARRG